MLMLNLQELSYIVVFSVINHKEYHKTSKISRDTCHVKYFLGFFLKSAFFSTLVGEITVKKLLEGQSKGDYLLSPPMYYR